MRTGRLRQCPATCLLCCILPCRPVLPARLPVGGGVPPVPHLHPRPAHAGDGLPCRHSGRRRRWHQRRRQPAARHQVPTRHAAGGWSTEAQHGKTGRTTLIGPFISNAGSCSTLSPTQPGLIVTLWGPACCTVLCVPQADSHSSSLGPGELPPSATAAGLLSTSTHAHTQHTQQQGGGSMLSGGQDSEAVTQEAAAGCGMAAHHPHGHANTGAGGAVAGVATPPEVTSADPEASQLPSDNSTQLPTPNGSGQANVAAALVSGLAVSSRDSPMAVSAMETATGTGMATTAAAGAAGMGVHGQQGQGVEAEWAGSNDAGGATAALNVPVAGSSSDMDVGTGVARRDGGGAGAAAVGRYSPAAASPGHGQAAGVAGAAGPPAAAPAVPLSPDQALQQCLGARGLACMVSLLIRLAHDAGCLWGYSGMVVGPAAASAGATGAPAPSRAQLRQAVECATQLGCRALGTLVRLLQLRDEALLEAFMADDRWALPYTRFPCNGAITTPSALRTWGISPGLTGQMTC